MSHINVLVNAQESDKMTLAPHLITQDVHAGQFGKLRVKHATNIFNGETARALLKTSIEDQLEAEAIAWF